MQLRILLLWMTSVLASASGQTLTQAEKDAGWQFLFDGQSTRGWLEASGRPFPAASWTVEDGWLKTRPRLGGLQDIRTAATFRWFELEWEWRCGVEGNSGVKYLLLGVDTRSAEKDEDRDVRGRGFEYQLAGEKGDIKALKDACYSAGALYGIFAPSGTFSGSADVHVSRLLVRDKHVEHWLDGRKILEYSLDAPELAALSRKRPFPASSAWDSPIVLQNHRQEFWFRNLKIRRLD